VNETQGRLKLGKLAIWAGPLATIAVSPSVSFDPINLIKLCVISTIGFGCFLLLVRQFVKSGNWKFDRGPLYVVLFFLIQLTLVFIISGNNSIQEFYGTSGRNTGFLAYFVMVCIFLAVQNSSTKVTLDYLVKSVLWTGALSAAYGFIQYLERDPANWLNPYSPVIGFLGNPDFQSAFLGIVASIAFGLLFSKNLSGLTRAIYVVLGLICLLVIQETKAQQGNLVFAVGVGTIIVLHIFQRRSRLLSISAISGFLLVGFIGALGSINKGPLASILFKDTVTFRGDYWQAGWQMSVEHPWFGVGLDTYGDWYRRTRTLEATLRRGPSITSDTAHNVFLDYSSNGGFPLLIAYLLFIVLTLIAVVKVFQKNEDVDPVFIAIVGGFVAFQAQSIVSINQIGLAIWGWLFMGIIIGYGLNYMDLSVLKKAPKQKGGNSSESKASASFVLLFFLGSVVGLAISLPNFIVDTNFKAALKSQDANRIIASAHSWPQDSVRTARVIGILRENQLNDQALALSKVAIARFPDFFGSWNELSQIPTATPAEIAEAKAQMKRLDPQNPDLK